MRHCGVRRGRKGSSRSGGAPRRLQLYAPADARRGLATHGPWLAPRSTTIRFIAMNQPRRRRFTVHGSRRAAADALTRGF